MKLTIKEIGDITGGQAVGDPSALVTGVSIDSRSIDKNQLFVPIKAKRNGHDFVSDVMVVSYLFTAFKRYFDYLVFSD